MFNNNLETFGQNNQFEYGNFMNNYNKFSFPNTNSFKNPKKGNKGISDFANNQKRDLTDIKHLEEIIQQVYQLKENNNNDAIQSDTKDLIINKIKMEILTLAKDVAGNYAIQKLLNNKKPFEINFIIEALKNKIYELTLN